MSIGRREKPEHKLREREVRAVGIGVIAAGKDLEDVFD